MCGRYDLHTRADEAAAYFSADLAGNASEVPPSWNIAPGRPVLGVVASRKGAARKLGALRWGLLPSWAADPAGRKWVNVRSETVATQHAFREAFRTRRCLIPANGWYEWRTEPPGSSKPKKSAYRLHAPAEPVLALAGIWETWRSAEGETLHTCAILTTAANSVTRSVHDRMPVIVPADAWHVWLAPEPLGDTDRAGLCRPAPDQLVTVTHVSALVGDVRHDGPELIEPLAIR